MSDDDLSRLQVVIASLRYWVPSIKDAARVVESEASGTWQIAVRPLFKEACPFVLKLSTGMSYAITLDGNAYPERPIESLDSLLPLVEAITDGHVVRRRWLSPNTGVAYQVETIVKLANGAIWRGLLKDPNTGPGQDPEYGIQQDRHYLPYRRR